MAFFGVEIKPGKPYTHTYDNERGRLRISQATLGTGTSMKKSSLQCNVGNKSPILLCNLIPNVSETFNLKLEFEEDEEVTFSVLGQTSVHLSGYYLGGPMSGDELDSHVEDIYGSGSESSDSYAEEDGSDSEFMDADDMDMLPPSERKSSVIIEEIEDEETPPNGKAKEKNQQNDSDRDKKKQRVETSNSLVESEDEDGFPVSSSSTPSTKMQQNMIEKDKKSIQRKSNKKKSPIESNKCGKDDGVKEEIAINNSDTKVKKKKKSKKGKVAEAIADESAEKTVYVKKDNKDPNVDKKHNEVTDFTPGKETSGKEKKNMKKRAKEVDEDSNVEGEKVGDIAKKIKKEKGKDLTSSLEQGKKIKASKSELKTQTLAGGLIIEDLGTGKPDGKKAVPGKKVSVKYIGKLLKTGKIFDSNVGQRPFQFRLGKGEVIRGWDVGVNGMKVGDKRRLTIPPSYGYGSRNMGPIPANSWLTFDVELVSVQ